MKQLRMDVKEVRRVNKTAAGRQDIVLVHLLDQVRQTDSRKAVVSRRSGSKE